MGVRRVCNIKPVNTLKNKQRDDPTDRQTGETMSATLMLIASGNAPNFNEL